MTRHRDAYKLAQTGSRLHYRAMGTDGYRAALIDLDGALARASLEITPRVADAVARLAEHVAVVIVSSRDHVVVRRTAASLGLTGLQISEGGGRIFDPVTGDRPWVRWLEPDDARGILTFLEPYGQPFTATAVDHDAHSVSEAKDWRVTRITAISLTEPQARKIATDFGVLEDVHTSIIVHIDNSDWMIDFTHHHQGNRRGPVRRHQRGGCVAADRRRRQLQ